MFNLNKKCFYNILGWTYVCENAKSELKHGIKINKKKIECSLIT